MKYIQNITLASIATLTFIGCGDSNNSNQDALKASKRSVKYLVDTDKMSLYIFDKDALNKSNCDLECQKIWPLFEGANSGSADIKVLEGTDHLAYRKHPLYYFVKDKVPGDILGNNVKNVWALVYAPAGTTDPQTTLSDNPITQTYLSDKEGRALYTFDKDAENVSNCYDNLLTSGEGCETTWPVFYSAKLGTLPAGTSSADFGTINRDANRAKKGESLKQTTYKGSPLYYFTPDAQNAGNTKGDWVKGVWHLVDIFPNN